MSSTTNSVPLVEIFTGPHCSFCVRAKALLRRKGLEYRERDISEPQTRLEMAQRLPRALSIPQIFVGGSHVGGCEDLEALEAAGEFDKMMAKGVQ